MKNNLIFLILIIIPLVLCSCKKENVIITSNTCSIAETTGSKLYFTMKANNDIITSISMNYLITPKALGITNEGINSLEEIDNITLENIKKDFIKELGLENNNQKGIEVNVEFNENMILTIDANLKKSDISILNKIGFNIDSNNMSLSKSVSDFTKKGYSCN